jgi:hypothetical protein
MNAARDVQERRLEHRQRGDVLDPGRRREHREDPAVGVADEMRSGLDQLGDLGGLLRERRLAARRVRPVAAAVGDDELQ